MKWRLFRHLLHGGNDEDATRVYLWTIEKRSGHRIREGVATDKWKRSLEDYLSSAKTLFVSMFQKGFDEAAPIPVDPQGELLDGSHRLACALALEIESVPVHYCKQKVWAPPWDYQWFVDHTMTNGDLKRLQDDWDEMCGRTDGC